MNLRSRRLFLLVLLASIALSGVAEAKGSVEVVEVSGIIDSSVEKSIIGNIERAEREDAALVVLQIDSRGSIGDGRIDRIVDAIEGSDVPVATWIGPPGAEAANGAALLPEAADIHAMAPGSVFGPYETDDLRHARASKPPEPALTAEDAEEQGITDIVEPALQDVIEAIDAPKIDEEATIRFHNIDIWGRLLHAAAQPSIAYLLLLAGLVGIVFELFHPSTGPAGFSGLVALAMSGYGIVTLGASPIGVALVVLGVAACCIDLRFESLGAFTLGGLAALIAGSLLMFRSPWLRPSPWVLAIGIIGMVLFLVGAMTRVLRDLRLIARGELEVTDAHPHPEGGHE